MGSVQFKYNHDITSLPVAIVRGAEHGPQVYIGAATHGDEINGVEVCRRLINNLDPMHVNGSIVIVPVQNPLGFLSRQRNNPVDGLENDSIYPGRSDGSLTERIAYFLYSTYASKCEYVIDIHTATTGGRNLPHVYVPFSNHDSSLIDSLELAIAFQPDLIIRVEPGIDYGFDLTHLSPFVAARDDRRGIYIEIGEGNRLERSYVERGYQGLVNVLARIGCLKSSDRAAKRNSRVVTRVSYVKSPAMGLLNVTTSLGADVRRGDRVAEIIEPLGPSKVCTAPTEGFVFRVQTYGLTKLNDNIVTIGHNP